MYDRAARERYFLEVLVCKYAMRQPAIFDNGLRQPVISSDVFQRFFWVPIFELWRQHGAAG